MKKKIISLLMILGCCALLSGCSVYWSYGEVVKNIDTKYFKARVLEEQDGCVFIVENELTGEKFVCIHGAYGVTLTPFKEVQENEN
jgi:hypothetical protein